MAPKKKAKKPKKKIQKGRKQETCTALTIIPKRSKPIRYSPEIAEEICSIIATTNKALATICAENEHFPVIATIFRWLDRIPSFREQYARAKEHQADFLADEIITISDHVAEDHTPFTGANVVNRDKLRVDARKWIASKLKPKKYGEKIELSGDKENPIAIQITGMIIK